VSGIQPKFHKAFFCVTMACQVPLKNIPALGAAPSKLTGTLVFHPSSITSSRLIDNDIEFAAAWAQRRGADCGLSRDEATDVHLEALHATITSSPACLHPTRELIRTSIDQVLSCRSASLFTRRINFPMLEDAWNALRKSLETREIWVLSVKQGVNEAAAVKDLKAAAAAVASAVTALGAKNVNQAVRWHFLHGQTEARELMLVQAREHQHQQQQQQIKEQLRLATLRHAMPKNKQTLYAKRPAIFKPSRPNTSNKKTPPAPPPAANISGGGGSDSDILEIPSPPTAFAAAAAAAPQLTTSHKRRAPASSSSNDKNSTAKKGYATEDFEEDAKNKEEEEVRTRMALTAIFCC
jgi:hypothetical protein